MLASVRLPTEGPPALHGLTAGRSLRAPLLTRLGESLSHVVQFIDGALLSRCPSTELCEQ